MSVTLATVTPGQLSTLTVPTLRSLATQAEIPGRSKMLRDDLIEALSAELDRREEQATEQPRPSVEVYARTVTQAPIPLGRTVTVTSLGQLPGHDATRGMVTGKLTYVGAPNGWHWLDIAGSNRPQAGPYMRSELVEVEPLRSQPEQQQAEQEQAGTPAQGPRMRLIGRRATKGNRRADRKAQRAARRSSRV